MPVLVPIFNRNYNFYPNNPTINLPKFITKLKPELTRAVKNVKTRLNIVLHTTYNIILNFANFQSFSVEKLLIDWVKVWLKEKIRNYYYLNKSKTNKLLRKT